MKYILIQLSLCILVFFCERAMGDQAKTAIDKQFNKEMDILYSELLTIEQTIGKKTRVLQMLKKIQATKLNMVSAKVQEGQAGAENTTSEPSLEEIYSKESTFNMMFQESLPISEIAISNSFVEKSVISSIQNATIVKFAYLYTPTFINEEKDLTNKIILTLQGDGHLGAYSINSGSLMARFDLNTALNEHRITNETIQTPENWTKDIQGFITENSDGYMSATISDFNGNVYIIDLILRSANLTKPEKQPVQVHKLLQIKSTSHFNVWQQTIDGNSTIYKEEIDALRKEGVQLRTMSYFSQNRVGTYVFSDNKGFFTLIKKESKLNSDPSAMNKHKYSLFVRTFSGFPEIKFVKQQMYLTLFTSEDKIGFIRTFDGKLSNSQCSVNGTDIVSIDFDQSIKGRFYVSTKNGEINVLHAMTSKKSDIDCALIGKIQGNPEGSSQILKLKKLLLTYDDTNGKFQVYNTTKALVVDGSLDFTPVFPVSYTPEYPQVEGTKNLPLDLEDSLTPTGHEILLRVPGTENQLILIDVIDTTFYGESWLLELLANKGLIFVICIILGLGYQLCRARARSESKAISGMKKTIEKSKTLQERKLEEISQKLAFFEKNNEGFASTAKGSFGDLDLKPNLRMNKTNSGGGSKKNVRFADDY